PHDEVDVPLPDAGFFAGGLVRHGQRPERLGGQLPPVGQHGQFAPAGGDDLPRHEYVVPEVHVGLPGGQRLRADPVQAQHHLQFGAAALPQNREAQLSGVPDEHDPAGDPHPLAGPGVRRKLSVLGMDPRQRAGTRHGHRIRLDAGRAQPVVLLPADSHLLGQVVGAAIVGHELDRTGPRPASCDLAYGTRCWRPFWLCPRLVLMLSEVFVAGSDDEAKGYLPAGAAAAGVSAVVETTGLTSMELDLLQSVLTEEPLKQGLREPGGGGSAYGGDQGPRGEDIRPTLTGALAALPADRFGAVATAWGAHDELAEADPADVRALLEELVGLAVTARQRECELYLWNALEPE